VDRQHDVHSRGSFGRLDGSHEWPSYDRFTECMSSLAALFGCQCTCPNVLGLSPDHAAVLSEHATDVGQRLALHERGYDPLLLLGESAAQCALNPGPLRAFFSHMDLNPLQKTPFSLVGFLIRVRIFLPLVGHSRTPSKDT